MQVTVTYTKEVLTDYFKFVFDKTGKKTKLCYGLGGGLSALFALTSLLLFVLKAPSAITYVSLAFLASSLSFTAVFSLIKLLYPRLSSDKMGKLQGKTVVYDFLTSSFTVSLPNGKGKRTFSYRNLYGVSLTENYIYIYRTAAAAYILPRNEEVLSLISGKITEL